MRVALARALTPQGVFIRAIPRLEPVHIPAAGGARAGAGLGQQLQRATSHAQQQISAQVVISSRICGERRAQRHGQQGRVRQV